MTSLLVRLLPALLVLLALALLFRGLALGAVGGLLLGVGLGLWYRRRADRRGAEEGERTGSGGSARGRRWAEVDSQSGDGAGPEASEPLSGTVSLAGMDWAVREEKRGGPFTQIVILEAIDEGSGVMHLRPPPGSPARNLDEVEVLAADPDYRYFGDPGGERWQARIVESVEEGDRRTRLVKFISRSGEVREGPYPGAGGLGHWTDEQLRELLARTEPVGA